MIGYVVESGVNGPDGKRAGTARIYVATPERAAELASQKPGATYRAIDYEDMPQPARENLQRVAPKQ